MNQHSDIPRKITNESVQTTHEIASKFVLEHKSTFGQVDEQEITAAVEKVARAIKGVQVAAQKARRLSDTTIPSVSKHDL